MNNRSSSTIKTLMLVLCALLWGFTFPFQSIATNYVGTYTFLAARSWVAVIFLIPVVKAADVFRAKAREKEIENLRKAYKSTNASVLGEETGSNSADADVSGTMAAQSAIPGKNSSRGTSAGNPRSRRLLLIAGALAGTALFAASAFQQTGIGYTTTAKASFITALYVILVPIFSLVLGKKVSGKIWLCVEISVVGLYFLCFKRGTLSGFQYGDLLMLAAAAVFALQIMTVDHFVSRVDPIRLNQLQIGMQGILATLFTFLFEHPTAADIGHAAFAIFFAGILSSGVAYTLQIVGQSGLDPTIASIAMCLESVFGAIGGWLIQGQTLSARETLGSALMFSAIILSQLPSRHSV